MGPGFRLAFAGTPLFSSLSSPLPGRRLTGCAVPKHKAAGAVMVAADPVPARAAGGFGDIMAWRRMAIGRRGRGRRHLGHRAAAGRTDRCPADGALPRIIGIGAGRDRPTVSPAARTPDNIEDFTVFTFYTKSP